ncbi:hypothetical protein MESS4_330213 [Mesorhizobium sp. STM 4661]|nr:hypothetical protein MESS4_330213 [Mesorhizobium sp. STM 4661]
MRIEAIRFFRIAGPNDFLMLTPERARALGIEVFEQDGMNAGRCQRLHAGAVRPAGGRRRARKSRCYC